MKLKPSLKALISRRESATLELKSSPTDWKLIVQTISSFSNAKGGTVLVGVKDDGTVIGVSIGKRTLEDLANKIRQNTDPAVFPRITTEDVEGKTLIVIEVEESKAKPVFAFDKVFKRVGRSDHRVTSAAIRKMALEGRKVYWDEQVCEGASLDDINWDIVNDFFIPKYEEVSHRKIIGKPEEIIESLGCVRENSPTNAGVLLFGKEPQRFFPNAFIALARYKGKAVSTERLDYKEFAGSLLNQIDECDRYIKEHIAVMSKLLPDRVERQDIPEYGWFSIRELITNAACHRDYYERGSKVIVKMFDDKIEFYNPGGLPEGITPKNIMKKQYSRNPVIARVLARVGYIEELGEGWDKLVEEHKNHPLKPRMPMIDADEHSVLVTIFSTKEKFEKPEMAVLNERQRKAIEYIREHGRITNREYRSLCPGVTPESLRKDLKNMEIKGILVKRGRKKGTYYELA